LFFQSDRGYGWTETWYSAGANYFQVLNAAKAMAAARVQMNGVNTALTFIRVSDDELKRDTLVYAVPVPDQRPTGLLTQASDIANTALVLRLEASPTKHSQMYLRGLPDDICTLGGRYTPNPLFLLALVNWQNVVTIGGWSLRGQNTPSPLDPTIANVGQPDIDGNVLITTNAAHGFLVRDLVKITGLIGGSGVRGTHRISSVPAATEFIIHAPRVGSRYIGGGRVTKIVYSLALIIAMQVLRVSHRIAGRPFDSPRGRRLVR
jgi:hypothetical protein